MEKRIGHLIDEMDKVERWVFICYYYNQMSIEEIVNETGFNKGVIMRYLINSSNKVIKKVGKGEIYYAALIAFLAMGEEAAICQP